ncbi:hypothetical protein [Geomicrobium sediminis]|uniref:Uncharacterized protein n=1 Tax=Geomicrobium sediminis TaxID=1347788 RepID=A0ABS2PF69_9BACL|nr:hypothetical protein [Geomicrobium sediminis]MBM7634050.1 hypothetical protein [Geomicrobium sediminis]
MSDEKRGLYGKYHIIRADGKPLKQDFKFVLSPENDPAGLEALKTYQRETTNMQLSKDLKLMIQVIEQEKGGEGR